MSNTDHDIYKQRGRMNIQIGLVLGVFVILVMIATMARLSTPEGQQGSQAANAPSVDAQAEGEATQ